MIFPIGDTNVKGGYKPFFSYSLILANIFIFFVQLNTPGNLVCELAAVPGDIAAGNHLYTLFTSMFLHGGWMHLLGNVLFLWVFADNIEAIVGNINFIFFYIIGGLVAAAIHIYFDMLFAGDAPINCCIPCAGTGNCADMSQLCAGFIPSLGASGAISAVMGAYIVMFPRSRIKMLFIIFPFSLPAIYFLGFWFADQLISGVGALGPLSAQASGVAWWAHIGGFIFGLVYGFLNKDKMSGVVRHYD